MIKEKISDKAVNKMENSNLKKISVSAKRQMTIPKQFYDELKIENEVICQIVDDALVIIPVHKGLDFSEFILGDLVKEGYSGESLLNEFSIRKKQINGAILKMVEETRDYKGYSNVDEYFNSLYEDEDE